MITLFLTAIGLGIAYTATPGAVNVESLRRGLSRGIRPAVVVQLGSLIGDAAWAAIALTSSAYFVQNRSVREFLGFSGALFLLWLSVGALREAHSGVEADPVPVSPVQSQGVPFSSAGRTRGDFGTGAFFSLANPFAVPYWLAIGGSLAASGSTGTQAGTIVVFTGFMLATLMWVLSIIALIAWGRRFIGPALFRWIDLGCGLALGYFGLMLLWNTARLLLG